MSTALSRISPWRLGVALGILWGLGLFIVAIFAHSSIYYGHPFIQTINSIYPGYSPTYEGAFYGLGWGFIDFFVFGFIAAWFYNRLLPSN